MADLRSRAKMIVAPRPPRLYATRPDWHQGVAFIFDGGAPVESTAGVVGYELPKALFQTAESPARRGKVPEAGTYRRSMGKVKA